MAFLTNADSDTQRYYDRKQLLSDVGAIRDLAESTALVPSYSEGPGEFHLDLSELTEASREAAEENAFMMQQMLDDGEETNLILTSMRKKMDEDLTSMAALAEATANQAEMTEDVYWAVKETNDHLHDLKVLGHQIDGQLTGVNSHLGDITDRLDVANLLLHGVGVAIERNGQAIRLSVEEMAERLANEHRRSTTVLFGTLTMLDKRAAERHVELVKLLRIPNAIQAEEKFAHAKHQFDAKEWALAARDLKDVFGFKSTHTPGWILAGRLFRHRGRADLARQAFGRAAKYALLEKSKEHYVLAITEGAVLERIVRNYAGAEKILHEALPNLDISVDEESVAAVDLSYLLLETQWANPKKTVTADEMADLLETHVFAHRAEALNQVVASHFWSEIIKVRPYWRFGNAPYLPLMRMIRERRVKMDETEVGIVRPGDTTYDELYALLEGGKKPHPKAVRDHLLLLQNPEKITAGRFKPGYQATVLFLADEYRKRGKAAKADKALARASAIWERDVPEGTYFPEIVIEKLRVLLSGPYDEAELLWKLDYVLPNAIRYNDDLREQVATKAIFAPCWKLRPWTTFTFRPFAGLNEAAESIRRHAEGTEWPPVLEKLIEHVHGLKDICADSSEPTDTAGMSKEEKAVARLIDEGYKRGMDTVKRRCEAILRDVTTRVDETYRRMYLLDWFHADLAWSNRKDLPDPRQILTKTTKQDHLWLAFVTVKLKIVLGIYKNKPGFDDDALAEIDQMLAPFIAEIPEAAKEIETSPVFEAYREERAKSEKRKRDAAEAAKRKKDEEAKRKKEEAAAKFAAARKAAAEAALAKEQVEAEARRAAERAREEEEHRRRDEAIARAREQDAQHRALVFRERFQSWSGFWRWIWYIFGLSS